MEHSPFFHLYCANLLEFGHGMHQLSYQPALSFHFPFSILNFPFAQRKIPLVSERDFPLPTWRIITSCPFAVRDTLSCRVIDGVPHARQHKEQAIRIAHRIAEQRADALPCGEVSGGADRHTPAPRRTRSQQSAPRIPDFLSRTFQFTRLPPFPNRKCGG